MKKIIAAAITLLVALVACSTTSAYSHCNRYGGSTSHSYGSTSHSSTYGTSTSHTYGEGTSHTNYYGGSTSHNYYGGTSTPTPTAVRLQEIRVWCGAHHALWLNELWLRLSSANCLLPISSTHAYYGYHPPTTVNYYGVRVLRLQ